MINAFFQKVAGKALMTLDMRADLERKCIENATGHDWDKILNLTEKRGNK